MGIPQFYKWLVDKYPQTVVSAVEEPPKMVNSVPLPIDTTLPNPNGVEFDNFYLDMNGIIHPCFHPEGVPPPKSYDEVFTFIFKYIDRLFSIVRPRKLLFLAIDGVAPRAKMNQQRSRRFRAAKEAAEEAMMKKPRKGVSKPEEEKSDISEDLKKMDSNVITPGTEFMELLSSAIKYYVQQRMNKDPGWQGIKVILSDATVPGEGEHKIMSYIRLQRDLPGFDPNTRHCLYGLDADLIMLALATHEVHFSILREFLYRGGKQAKQKRYKLMSQIWKNGRTYLKKKGKVINNLEDYILGLNFEFLNIWVLREYLEYAMRIPGLTWQPDLERLIDDFIFMCLFVGNDFLPHIPTLAISEGAIDLLMMVYKNEFLQMGGYLTNSFEVNLARVEHFIQALGCYESGISERVRKRRKKKLKTKQELLKRKLVKMLQNNPNAGSTSLQSSLMVEKADGMNIKGSICHLSYRAEAVVGKETWKENYYANKFEAKTKEELEKIRRHVVFKYIEGICWIMRYYYEGVCSWHWFYPYHYAPFASDFCGLEQLEIHFTLGEPFKPIDQLMGVLPAASAHALPVCYRRLMTDESSPILDFYPSDFKLDMNGKRKKWQAVCILPFIDESRLLFEISKVEHTLTDDERRRNNLGLNILFVHVSHPLADMIVPLSKQNYGPDILHAIDPKISGGMNGFVCISEKPVWPLEVYSTVDGIQMLANDKVISVSYKYPQFHRHISQLPQGVILPSKCLSEQDISPLLPLHETSVSIVEPSRRPIPKSVSGPHLPNLTHRPVALRYPAKQDSHGYKGPNVRVDAYKMGGVKRKVSFRKRKQSRDNNHNNNNVSIDDGGEERKRREGEDVPHSREKLKQSVCTKERDGNHAVAGGVKDIKIEVQSKNKRKLRESKQSEGFGILCTNVVQSEYHIHKNQRQFESINSEKKGGCSTIEKLDGSIVWENKKADESRAAAERVVEVMTQVKSKKKRKRSPQRRRIEADENYVSGEQTGGDSNHVSSDGFRQTGNSVPSNNIEQLESSGHTEQIDVNVGADGKEIKPGVRTRKRKRGKKQKQSGLNGSQNNSDVVKEGGDGGDHVGLGSAAEIRTEVEFRKTIDSLEGVESGVIRKQAGSDGDPAGVAGKQGGGNDGEHVGGSGDHVDLDAAAEIKTQVKVRKKKPRSKRRKKIQERVEAVVVRKLSNADGDHGGLGAVIENKNVVATSKQGSENSSDHVALGVDRKLSGADGDHGGLGAVAEIKNVVATSKQGSENSDHVDLGAAAGIKTQVKSRKRKQRSKRRKEIREGLEGVEVGVVMKLRGANGDHGSLGAVIETKNVVVPSKQGSENSGYVDIGVARKLSGANGDHVGLGAVTELKNVVATGKQGSESSGHVDLGAATKIKTQVESRKRKQRSKRRKKIQECLEGVEAGVVRKISGADGDHGGLGAVTETKDVATSKQGGENSDHVDLGVPRKLSGAGSDHGGLGAGTEIKNVVAISKQGSENSDPVDLGASAEIKTQVISRKRKQRSKRKKKIQEGLEGVEAGVVRKLSGADDDHGGLGAVTETKNVVASTKQGSENSNHVDLGVARKLSGANGDHGGLGAVTEIKNAVPASKQGSENGDHVDLAAAAEIKTQVKSRKRKQRSKRRKKIQDGPEGVEAGVVRKLSGADGEPGGLGAVTETKIVVATSKQDSENGDHADPGVARKLSGANGDHGGLGGVTEIKNVVATSKHGSENSDHVGLDAAAGIKT